jgi:hypothetical protein
VHRRAVERIVALVDAQEAGGQLEGLLAEARDLPERLPVAESAVPVAVRDDVRASVGLSPETRVNSGTEAVLTSTPTAFTQSSTTALSALRELRLADVMLVLADPDRLGDRS